MVDTKLVTITASCAVGKDTLLNMVCKEYPQVHKMVSFTSRPPRAYEIDGFDYYFVDLDTFNQMEDDDKFIEVRYYNTEHGIWKYGLPKSEIRDDSTNVVVVDADGALEVKGFCDDNGIKCTSIFLNASVKNRITRYLNRDKVSDGECYEMCRRVLDDRIAVQPFENHADFVWMSENINDLAENVNKFGELL